MEKNLGNLQLNDSAIQGDILKMPFRILIIAGFLLISILTVFVSSQTNNALINLIVPFGIAVLCLFFKYPKLWVFFLYASCGYFILDNSTDVSVMDYLFTVFYIGGLLIWLFWTVMVKREKIIENIADWFLLAYFVLLLLNLAVSLANGTDLLLWLREYLIRMIVLIVFPVKYILKTKKDYYTALTILGLTVVYFTYHISSNFITNTMSVVKDYFQMGMVSRFADIFFGISSIAGIVLMFYSKKIISKVIILCFEIIFIGGLVVIMNRSQWVSFIAAMLILLVFYFNFKQRLNVFIMLAIAAFSIFLLSNFFLKSYADFYFTVLEKKFISTTEGKRDPSIKVRFYEYQEITKKIEQSPIGGHGMGSSYSYFQPLANVTHTSTFTHNGYLNNIWRIGTPLFCFYLFFIIYYMIKAFYLAFIDKNNYFKPFLLIGGIALFDIVISSMVSDMFHQRESYFAISISIALISFSERELRKMNLLKYPPLRTIIYKRKT